MKWIRMNMEVGLSIHPSSGLSFKDLAYSLQPVNPFSLRITIICLDKLKGIPAYSVFFITIP